jgi:hypothetical protein
MEKEKTAVDFGIIWGSPRTIEWVAVCQNLIQDLFVAECEEIWLAAASFSCPSPHRGLELGLG